MRRMVDINRQLETIIVLEEFKKELEDEMNQVEGTGACQLTVHSVP